MKDWHKMILICLLCLGIISAAVLLFEALFG